jgi:hypothetical protein
MLEGATTLEMNYPLTSLIENKGDGTFEIHPLPMIAQIAPVFGLQTMDVNADGHLDIVMIGNDYGMELSIGRCDAFNGLILKGNGDLNFTPMSLEETGFVVPGDGKSLVQYISNNQLHLLAGQNKETIQHFTQSIKGQVFNFEKKDAYVLVQDKKQNIYKVETYYGNGFLSQSDRFFILPEGHQVIKVIKMKGEERPIE